MEMRVLGVPKTTFQHSDARTGQEMQEFKREIQPQHIVFVRDRLLLEHAALDLVHEAPRIAEKAFHLAEDALGVFRFLERRERARSLVRNRQGVVNCARTSKTAHVAAESKKSCHVLRFPTRKFGPYRSETQRIGTNSRRFPTGRN